MNSQRIENLTSAVSSLQEYVEEPITSKRDRSGTIFGFLMAFELAWKCLQDQIIDLGYTERGPKPVLGVALKAGLIAVESEPIWSQMLEDRNLATYAYDEDMALQMTKRIAETYISELESLVSQQKSQPRK